MIQMRYLVPLTILLTLTACSSFVNAEEGGWSWGPLSSSTKKTDSGVMEKSSSSKSWMPEWKAPDVVGGVKRTGRAVANTTSSAWNSTARTTKKAWKKTTEVLDPFPDKPTESLNSSPWATGKGSEASKSSKSSSSSGSFNWFGSKETTPEKPATPQDFLRQDRP